jgi:hypothetical protein
MYQAVKANPSYWNTYFPVSGMPYALVGTTTSGNFVNATVTSSEAAHAGNIVFEMSTDSDYNAVILTITFNNTPIFK